MIDLYIKELLFTSDCVIIPEFGAFICSYSGAEISISKNKISPPFKKIAFNDKLKINDGKLLNHISHNENISISIAEENVKKFIANISEKLSTTKLFEIPDLGKFLITENQTLIFEQYFNKNYLEDSFGLPDLYFTQIERTQHNSIFNQKIQKPMAENINQNLEDENINSSENEEMEEVDVDEFVSGTKTNKKSSLSIYYVLSFIALLFVGATTYYLNMDKNTYAIGSFSPLSWFGGSSDENKENKLLPEEAVSESESSSEDNTQTNGDFSQESSTESASVSTSEQLLDAITSQTGRYYVIVGSFKRPSKAINLRNSLNSSGMSPKIIKENGNAKMLRVSAMDFDSYEEASNKKAELIQTYGDDLWVLTY